MLLLIAAVTLAALSAFNTAADAGRHRQDSLALIHAVQLEVGLLGRLVNSYVSTADPRFLIYYYDVLAIREGTKPRPRDLPASFWEQVIAGRREYVVPTDGEREPLALLAGRLGFDAGEQAVVGRIQLITERMKETEQIAFAATQGLYDRETSEFVSEAEPQPEFASQLLHQSLYLGLRADLALAVEELASLVDQRTANELEQASERLRAWIFGELLALLLSGAVLLASYRYLERHLLDPLTALHGAAQALAGKSFGQRIGDLHGVEEVQSLATTLDGMAAAIEAELHQREVTQNELNEARARAEVATEAKSIFLANMSHEIRTPMNAILGMAYLAMKSGLPPRQLDYVSKIHVAARLLLGIINDILDFSKIEAGKVELERTPFELEPVIQNALFMVQQRAEGKPVELILDWRLPAEMPPLLGDPLRLGQILINLLSNAVKFTERGHVRLSISEVGYGEGDVALLFAVEDTGIGMDDEQRGRLFQEFTQADGATTRKYGGTGLGLTISKRLIEAMGGQIGVDSVSGRGSLFHFQLTFPLAGGGAGGAGDKSFSACTRALIVDDYAPTRDSLTAMLHTIGCAHVDQAANGDEALVRLLTEAAAGTPYDLLLLDWEMQGLAGSRLIEAARVRELSLPACTLAMSTADVGLLRAEVTFPEVGELAQKPLLPGVLRRLCRRLPGTASGQPVALTGSLAPDLGGMHILLVEDHELNRQVASEMLVGWGATVDVAEDGLVALEKLLAAPADRYALVLMDLEMPVMDGREAIRRLRAERRFIDLPVIVMTAHVQGAELQRALAQGASSYIAKPFDPDELLASIARHSHRSKPPPATTSGATPAEQSFLTALRAIPEVDVAVLEKRFSGRLRFLAEAIRYFVDDARQLPVRLRNAIELGDTDTARRDAHSFKGLSGTFGLRQLQEVLRRLELAIAPQALVESELVAVERCLGAVLDALGGLPVVAGEAQPKGQVGDVEVVVTLLVRHLRDGDGEAEEMWRNNRTLLASRYSPRQLAKIERAIAHWDCDAAIQALGEPLGREESK
ncbi:MAG: hybrid sensor histidine kinase/response regulator [Betaproteobacteria bacterium HGW-Betaproteobacteria-7]|jgi:signal transduction histidine kinase/CheY-like chemotaxis protein|nr:MAG: hybrid sensor histidine kinase/response regulator [Betaproteobacteria bacterium HGW-Betaproteobacteria-7]